MSFRALYDGRRPCKTLSDAGRFPPTVCFYLGNRVLVLINYKKKKKNQNTSCVLSYETSAFSTETSTLPIGPTRTSCVRVVVGDRKPRSPTRPDPSPGFVFYDSVSPFRLRLRARVCVCKRTVVYVFEKKKKRFLIFLLPPVSWRAPTNPLYKSVPFSASAAFSTPRQAVSLVNCVLARQARLLVPFLRPVDEPPRGRLLFGNRFRKHRHGAPRVCNGPSWKPRRGFLRHHRRRKTKHLAVYRNRSGHGVVAPVRTPPPLRAPWIIRLISPGSSVIATIAIGVYWPTLVVWRDRLPLTIRRAAFTVRQRNITFAADVSEQNDPKSAVENPGRRHSHDLSAHNDVRYAFLRDAPGWQAPPRPVKKKKKILIIPIHVRTVYITSIGYITVCSGSISFSAQTSSSSYTTYTDKSYF